jgi:glycosyltransferase involved in cell wall biosynthesis
MRVNASEVPVVSVVVPVYNRGAMLVEAVQSVLAASAEVPLEIIVVDDASTDDTWEVVSGLASRVVRTIRLDVNGGQSAARNRGIEAARGTYLKFLDSDDLLIAAHLPREVQALRAGGCEIAVSGWSDLNTDTGAVRHSPAPVFHSIIDDVLAGVAVPTGAALYVRKPDWRWDPSLRKLDDWDFFCQAALDTRAIASVPGEAYVMREHGGPRATDATMLANAREHHHILGSIEQKLAARGELTEPRRRRLAQYYYKELRVLSLNDREAFETATSHILTLDTSFSPRDEERQRFMRVAARVLGFRRAVLLHTAVKRMARRGGQAG